MCSRSPGGGAFLRARLAGRQGLYARSKGSALAEWVVSALMQVCLLTPVFGADLNAAALDRHFAGRS